MSFFCQIERRMKSAYYHYDYTKFERICQHVPQNVQHPSPIQSLFPSIGYKKGVCQMQFALETPFFYSVFVDAHASVLRRFLPLTSATAPQISMASIALPESDPKQPTRPLSVFSTPQTAQ